MSGFGFLEALLEADERRRRWSIDAMTGIITFSAQMGKVAAALRARKEFQCIDLDGWETDGGRPAPGVLEPIAPTRQMKRAAERAAEKAWRKFRAERAAERAASEKRRTAR
jgi:hypothetical protein